MTIVVAVDPAARRLDAVVLYPDGSFVIHTRKTMPPDIVHRCVVAQRWLELILRPLMAEDTVVCGVEEPFVGKFPGGMLPVAKVHGALIAASGKLGVNTICLPNKRWKMTVVGKGNASKPEINVWVKKHWPKLWKECKGRQDVCDAACMALEVRRILKSRARVAATRRRYALVKKE